MEPPSSILDDYFSLGITLILILFSYALIKGIEFALFSFSSKEAEYLKQKGTKNSKRVLNHLSNPEIISWTFFQISVLLQISLLFIVVELFNKIIYRESNLLVFSLSVLIASLLLLKYSGRFLINPLSKDERSLNFALFTSSLISFLMFLAKPFNMMLSRFTHILSESREERDAQSIEEYTDVVDVTDKEEIEEKKLLKGIVGLTNTSVFQIMKPRVEIVSLNFEMTSAEVVNKAIEYGFSRLPVYESSRDNIKGFLYIKDLVGYLKDNTMDFDWHKHIREAYFVPGSKKIGDLLEEFRQKKIHLALVVDEYGGTDGIVTLEDILEEIVGEISDETDKNE